MRSPLLLIAASCALGIWAAACAQERGAQPLASAASLLAIGAVLCLLGLIALRRGGEWVPTFAVLAGFSVAGAAAQFLFPLRFGPHHISRMEERGIKPGRAVFLEGTLATTPLREPYGMAFDLDVAAVEQDGRKQESSGRVRLWVETARGVSGGGPFDFMSGEWVRVSTRLHRPRVYQNPGSFDYRGWLESIQDIAWVGTVRGVGGMERISRPEAVWTQRGVRALRRNGLAAIDRMFPPWGGQARDGSVLKAVLFGDRSALDSETIENFRKTGLYHLLVVAGLHVGLVALLATLLLRLFPLSELARSSLVLALVAAYALVVDERAPTLRATIMIAAYLVGRMLYRERSLLNAVGLAALVLLFVRPAWLFEAGFDLSFAAALLIAGLAVPILDRTIEPYRLSLYRLDDVNVEIGLAPRLAQFRIDVRALVQALESRFPALSRRPGAGFAVVTTLRIVFWGGEGLLFSIILQCGLILPMVAVFHRVTFVGIGLNALSLPLMALVLAVALPSVVVVAFVPSLAPIPAAVLGIILRLLFALTDLPHLPVWLSYRLPGPPLWVALGFAASLVLAAWALTRHPRIFAASGASFAFFLTLVCLHPFPPELPKGVMEVTALDCGEGEATLVVLSDRTTALINTCGARERVANAFSGRPWNAGEDIVSPYLWSRGIERLDFVALTRAPGDQRASLEDLAKNFKVGNFWLDTANGSPEAYTLLDDLARRGARARELKGGERLALGGASFRVLSPAGPNAEGSPTSDSQEGDPMVVEVSEGKASVLFAGNLNEKAARALMSSGEKIESRLLEIRLGRSSQSYEQDFVRAVSPEIAWTGGARSRRPEDSSRWDFLRTRFFHIDTDGAIEMTQDGGGLAVRLYRSSSTGSGAGTGAGWVVTSPASSVP